MRIAPLAASLLLLGGCGFSGTDGNKSATSTTAATTETATVDVLAAHDPAPGATAAADPAQIPDSEERPLMQAQVVLDRLGFTPGVVDGQEGQSTRNAVSGFQQANNLTVTGKMDDATKQALGQYNAITATRVVTIPAEFAAGPFYMIPKDPQDQARMQSMGYESLDEKLAERFHTTLATLKLLNPGGMPAGMKAGQASGMASGMVPSSAATPMARASGMATVSPSSAASGMASGSAATFTPTPGPASFFHEGQQIRVPNVGGDTINTASVTDTKWLATLQMLGVGSEQPKAAKIVVSKSKGTLSAFDEAGKLIAVYTATMGSQHDPLPLGNWKIQGVSRNPTFHYNPALFWDAKAGSEKATIPPGPNGSVGVVWIDLSKPHYGIHGTPRPETIGRAESHGCVRLTNWDAARLAQMVSTKTAVSFEA